MTTSMSEARAAKEDVKRLLAGVNGISGIGVGWDNDGSAIVLVNLDRQALPQVRQILASHPVNVPVALEPVGMITSGG